MKLEKKVNMNVIKKVVFEVDYNDLDDAISDFLVEKGLKGNYECVVCEEWGNDESHSFTVTPRIRESNKKDIVARNLNYQTAILLDWMCAEGKIEPGEYLVNISW